jgi:acyl-phosphate glycerol 3-phosphate acyltransferase
MSAIITLIIIAFVVGGIPTGYWLVKLLKGVDVRTIGSGSTGATNVYRAAGPVAGILVLLLDLSKGAFPVLLGKAMSDPSNPWHLPEFMCLALPDATLSLVAKIVWEHNILPPIGGIVSMIGHSKSIFMKFQGGKSAATGVGTLMACNFGAGMSTFVLWALTVAVVRIVSVASILAGLTCAIFMYLFHAPMSFVIYAAIGGGYVIIRHRANMKRLLEGTEPKLGQKHKTKEGDAAAEGQDPATAESGSAKSENGEKKITPGDQSMTSMGSLILSGILALSGIISGATAVDAAQPQPKQISQNPSSKGAAKSSSTSLPKSPILPKSSVGLPILTPEEVTNIRVYKLYSSAVVNITAVAAPTPEQLMFGVAPSPDTGSGSIISTEGYILTNNHVINNARMVRVTLFDGSSYPAKVIGADPDNDLAVIKIEPGTKKLNTVKFGDSSRLEVGRRVYTIGNPFGLELTMTSGIISSVGRSLSSGNRVIKGVLQTDAAINPGNSGGPLLDTQGNVIGVTTAIYSKVQQSSGIGFAIPINIVKRVVPQLIAHGAVLRPNLGIAKVLPTELGLMIVMVEADGPALQAGLRGPQVQRFEQNGWAFQKVDNSAADTIVGIDNQPVHSVDDLLSYVETKKPGQVVTLSVLRQGKLTKVPVKLAESKVNP